MKRLEKKFKKRLPKSIKKYIRSIKKYLRSELKKENEINDKIKEILKIKNLLIEDD